MTEIEMKPPPIRNKEAAMVQITSEQILKEAEIHRPTPLKPPIQRIMDTKELEVYKQEKRRDFEDKLRRQRYNLSTWVRYAQWEENLKEFVRSRSIFQRAIEIDYANKSLWLKYAEMEMKNKFINHARNVWERATYYIPREDQFWFKYSYMEELIGEYDKARNVFQKWMQWQPGEKAWISFFKFEERMGQPEKARGVLYQFLESHPTLSTYLKVAKFEFKNRNKEATRKIFERIITELGDESLKEEYFIQFGKFQIKQRQYDRAREIFKFGLKQIPKENASKLYEIYLNFEKEHGNKNEIDEVILGERRNVYKSLIAQNPLNYDAWLNLLELEESFKDVEKIRGIYEAAVQNIPPAQEKRYWRRYIYLWYNYAIFEEEIAEDLSKAETVYERAIKLIPHKQFTFGKLWVYFAHFYLRCCDLVKARRIFGQAIGLHPKQKVFKSYIELEESLCQLDRVRMIYEKYCEKFTNLPQPWIEFASFEASLQEYQRSREILQIGEQMQVEGLPDPYEFIEKVKLENQMEGEEEEE